MLYIWIRKGTWTLSLDICGIANLPDMPINIYLLIKIGTVPISEAEENNTGY